MRIPDRPLAEEDIGVLYDFGFEYFGERHGTQRLMHRSDDQLADYDEDADSTLGQIMDDAGAQWILYDCQEHDWVPVKDGDWVVEPRVDDCDGFTRMSNEEFLKDWDLVEK